MSERTTEGQPAVSKEVEEEAMDVEVRQVKDQMSSRIS